MKKVTHCEKCWHSHTPAYHLKDKIDAKGYPTSSPKYKTAHEEATKAEKAHFPRKDYDKLKHMDESIPRGQLIGKNAASGKITVSKKVPKPLRDEVAYHERVESKILRKKKK